MRLIGDEMGSDPERRAGVRRRLVNGAIAARLPASAVDQQALAVETVESAEAEIAMTQNIGDAHAAAKNALDQRARSRHLIDRMMLDVEHLGEGRRDRVIEAFARALAMRLQSVP
jgi:hypothetical protein